jgi:hypothetical protein
MYHHVVVTRAHVFKGDPLEPEDHPVALAFKEAFPRSTSEVHYDRYVGWYVQVGRYGWPLVGRAVVDLCDDLNGHGVDYDLWDVWHPDPVTYKVWVWEKYRSINLTAKVPYLCAQAWYEVCVYCGGLYRPCYMIELPEHFGGRICEFCGDREPELEADE